MSVLLRRRHCGRIFALALAVALLPLPVLADEGPAAVKPGIRVSAAAIATSEPLAATAAPAAQSGPSDAGSVSFFKKPVGIAALIVFAAGVGYAVYSTQNDRISSPAKK
ncbi:MAG TPA: hypothetical protein PKK95_01960 [Vicinamibacterales bacterium]|nr:hypothetical protein [Acidobacteriota bacterium]HOC16998.1 hypothetical protein [Vicinamibacterales bacterium]